MDCRRTDRNQPLFAIPPPTPDVDASAKSKNRRPHPTVSLQSDEYGAQSPSNEHIERLSNILLTYNFYEKELGTFVSSFYILNLPDHMRLFFRRLCAGHVRPLCTDLCGNGCR